MGGHKPDMQEYIDRLRAALAGAQAEEAQSVQAMRDGPTDPDNVETKVLANMAAVCAGEVIGLTRALSLATGEELTPRLTFANFERWEGR